MAVQLYSLLILLKWHFEPKPYSLYQNDESETISYVSLSWKSSYRHAITRSTATSCQGLTFIMNYLHLSSNIQWIIGFLCVALIHVSNAVSTPTVEASFNISQVTLNSNVSFYVGSIHRDWCFLVEVEQVKVIENALLKFQHSKPCLVVDVGMNDGFYSNMGAAFGCQVYAFELQRKCIDFSRQVVMRNGFESLVNIFHLLVSSKNNEVINIQYPKQEYCDGGFTMSGTRKAQRSRSKQPLVVNGNNFSPVCISITQYSFPFLRSLSSPNSSNLSCGGFG